MRSEIEAVLAGERRWCIVEGESLRLIDELERGVLDAVITDAPYSSGGATRGDRTASTKTKYVNNDSVHGQTLPNFEGDGRDQRSFAHWCALWFSSCWLATKPGGLLLSFTDWRQLPAMTDAVQAGGWIWRGIVPWDKTEATRPQKCRPRQQCEYMIFATKGPHEPWGDDAPCIPGFYTCPTPRDRVHITQKPERLLRDLATLVPPDGVILDPFTGSGTHILGALAEGRRAIGFELDPTIASIARERLAAAEHGLTLQDARAGQVPLFGGAV